MLVTMVQLEAVTLTLYRFHMTCSPQSSQYGLRCCRILLLYRRRKDPQSGEPSTEVAIQWTTIAVQQ